MIDGGTQRPGPRPAWPRPAWPRHRHDGGGARRHRGPAYALALAALATTPHPAVAAGCDLSQVIGYTLVVMKTIEGYIEAGTRKRGFIGCQPDRVLVFTDNTGVRCKDVSLQRLDIPRAYLFAKSATDIKLCVGDEILNVAPAQ
jgi:hypothetical protein